MTLVGFTPNKDFFYFMAKDVPRKFMVIVFFQSLICINGSDYSLNAYYVPIVIIGLAG